MAKPLLTQAERMDFHQTSRNTDVSTFTRTLARLYHESVHLAYFGQSYEARKMRYLVVSEGRLFTPEAAHASGKPVVLIVANVHGGEVDGKEASLMLARDLVQGKLPPLHRDAVIVIAPLFNVDGNDRISRENRKLDMEKREGQMGPEWGAGIRATAQGYDLNRQYMTQEAVEMRNFAALYLQWRPHVTIDCHTTDGSPHGYHLTYDTARNTAGHPAPREYVRTRLLPEVTRRLEARTAYRTFFYGNFKDENDPSLGWETYPALPRFGSHYRGLTNRMDILAESYSYISFRDRTFVSYEFLREVLAYVGEHGEEIRRIVEEAERDTVARGERPAADDLVGLRHEVRAYPEPVAIVRPDGTLGPPGPHYADFAATKTVRRPFAYLFPAELEPIARRLAGHGIRVERLEREATLAAEVYRVDAVDAVERSAYLQPGQRAEPLLRVTARSEDRAFPAGSFVVRAAQPLANVAIYLLEPESDDGLVAWRHFDPWVAPGRDFPVCRALGPADLPTIVWSPGR